MTVVDEAVAPAGRPDAYQPRWALGWCKQFDLVRAEDGVCYLTRWWLVATPLGGIAVHRMLAPDARETIHDHPFDAVSIVLRGGYVEDRLRPEQMVVERGHRVRWLNVLRAGIDAHSIRRLLRVPTWTLLFVGRKQRKWGFWDPCTRVVEVRDEGDSLVFVTEPTGEWIWTEHDAFDSGSYVPLPDGTR